MKRKQTDISQKAEYETPSTCPPTETLKDKQLIKQILSKSGKTVKDLQKPNEYRIIEKATQKFYGLFSLALLLPSPLAAALEPREAHTAAA